MPPFQPGAYHVSEGGFIAAHWDSEEYYADWLGGDLTLYRSQRDDHVVGCQVSLRVLTGFSVSDEDIGQAVLNAIIKGGMVRADEQESNLLIWKGNAAEQLGAAVRSFLKGRKV